MIVTEGTWNDWFMKATQKEVVISILWDRKGYSVTRLYSAPDETSVAEVVLENDLWKGNITGQISHFPNSETGWGEFWDNKFPKLELAHIALHSKASGAILCAIPSRDGGWEMLPISSWWPMQQLSTLRVWLHLQSSISSQLKIVDARLCAAFRQLNKERAAVTGEFIG